MYIFSGTPSRDRRIKRDSGLARPFLFLQKNICFAVQIPRKLDICMKTYIILSSKNDSSILDRQVRDCPDVSEKTVPQRIPRRFARDKNGKRIEIPSNMTFNEWKKKYID